MALTPVAVQTVFELKVQELPLMFPEAHAAPRVPYSAAYDAISRILGKAIYLIGGIEKISGTRTGLVQLN